MSDFDLIITASCYFSPEHAARLIKSVSVIKGNVMPIITCPRLTDYKILCGLVSGENLNYTILKTERNERHLCQDLGFLAFYKRGTRSRYIMFADDDIEFILPDILDYLDHCPVSYSTFGFSSSNTHYGIGPFLGQSRVGEYTINPIWIDGHNLTVKWDDALQYGLFDSIPGNYNSSSVEVEIYHRYRILSGRPGLGCKYQPIIHWSRVNDVEKKRDEVNKQSVIECGYKLWEKKYGLVLGSDYFHERHLGWEDVFAYVNSPGNRDKLKRHMILDGIWTDYDAAWDKFSYAVSQWNERRLIGNLVTGNRFINNSNIKG